MPFVKCRKSRSILISLSARFPLSLKDFVNQINIIYITYYSIAILYSVSASSPIKVKSIGALAYLETEISTMILIFFWGIFPVMLRFQVVHERSNQLRLFSFAIAPKLYRFYLNLLQIVAGGQGASENVDLAKVLFLKDALKNKESSRDRSCSEPTNFILLRLFIFFSFVLAVYGYFCCVIFQKWYY